MGCVPSKDKDVKEEINAIANTISINEQYERATYANTAPFFPSFTEGKCVKVYDGDTFHVASYVDGKMQRFMIRSWGYDSPELRTKNPKEKEAGIIARDFLANRIMNKIIKIEIKPVKEKYGRNLAIISDDNGEINQWMIDNGHGVPYFGGHKDEYT